MVLTGLHSRFESRDLLARRSVQNRGNPFEQLGLPLDTDDLTTAPQAAPERRITIGRSVIMYVPTKSILTDRRVLYHSMTTP